MGSRHWSADARDASATTSRALRKTLPFDCEGRPTPSCEQAGALAPAHNFWACQAATLQQDKWHLHLPGRVRTQPRDDEPCHSQQLRTAPLLTTH